MNGLIQTKTGFTESELDTDWPVSVRHTSDWVTPLRTSQWTSLSSLLGECVSDAELPLSNDNRPSYA